MSNYKALISDFSRTVIFPKDDTYNGSLNKLFKDVGKEKLSDNYYLNEDYLRFLQEKAGGLDKYIFTTGMFCNDAELRPRVNAVFKGVFEPNDLAGGGKEDPESFKNLATKLGLQTNEMIFIDDNPEFIAAADEAGLKVLKFMGNETTLPELEKILAE